MRRRDFLKSGAVVVAALCLPPAEAALNKESVIRNCTFDGAAVKLEAYSERILIGDGWKNAKLIFPTHYQQVFDGVPRLELNDGAWIFVTWYDGSTELGVHEPYRRERWELREGEWVGTNVLVNAAG